MFESFRKWLRAEDSDLPAIPHGQRVYAIGDIHGRLDLLQKLIAEIEHDESSLPPAQTTLILLGDLVDRGPDSAGVIAFARQLQGERTTRILGGNHEDMFLLAFKKRPALRSFLRFGGRETLMSYGIAEKHIDKLGYEDLLEKMKKKVPKADREFIRGFEDWVEIGDYLFVHAGIAPGRPLDEQRTHDVRWIREPFLSHSAPHSHVVVHGHTISEAVEDKGNRIGIDTGAYVTGRLTALALEGTERRIIEALD